MRNNRIPETTLARIFIIFEQILAVKRSVELFTEETMLLQRADSLCGQLSTAARKFNASSEELTLSLWADHPSSTPADIRRSQALVDQARATIMRFAFSLVLTLGLILITHTVIRSKFFVLDHPILGMSSVGIFALALGYIVLTNLRASNLHFRNFESANLAWRVNIRILKEDLIPALESELRLLSSIETTEEFAAFSNGMLSRETESKLHRSSRIVVMQLVFIGERARRLFEHSETRRHRESSSEAITIGQPLPPVYNSQRGHFSLMLVPLQRRLTLAPLEALLTQALEEVPCNYQHFLLRMAKEFQ